MPMYAMKYYWKTYTTLTLLTIALALGMGGAVFHYLTQAYASKTDQAPEHMPTPTVDVVTLQPQSVRTWREFSSRLRAVDYVEVRPQVGGTITQVLFEEGAIVHKGDPLFVIDPRPFEAEFASARAELESARSRATMAKQELSRAQGLVKKNAISQSRFDAATNDYKVAIASINAAKARITRATLDLEYAHIKAPVTGRISRAEITEGNVIEAGPNAPVLATIVSVDRLYAEFDVDEQTYVSTRRQATGDTMPVQLTLTSDQSVIYEGIIHSFDNQLDTTSGTIRARAIFSNTDGVLVPGMFATVQMGSPTEQSMLLINDRAVRTDQDKKYVYVVTPENTVAYREVKLGRAIEGKRMVHSGLEAGDQVLVNSLQRVRPDMEVQPIELSNSITPKFES
ncbi:efflux RND transporter periplasmic adaptor subunit [Candidatus Nitronereus thalassa]|uniref:Efflux RND transporter periplasmic adaptor subunit n=1 Tax=Candidatus Nitronereus thalassa TaxID=3020898 RepID=A0ABU3KDK2_9BACT|nr:efflux RND transporter periplasmic adaptor subunit [Candidatus Nitronereus thalassa]MDT7044282.1 efflux RND transporter periplasmic adaptor subunit [Candidatus Nitronereus thalassa]